MSSYPTTNGRNPLLLCVFVLGLMASLIVLPSFFLSEAGGKKAKGLIERTESHVDGIENYDIRADKSAIEKLSQFRNSAGKDSAVVADLRSDFVRGEELLKAKVPTLKVEYNTDIRTPEVIAPDVKQGRTFLTSASGGNRAEILRNFVKENESLIGVNDAQANQLKVTANYTNPDGNLSFAHLEQLINDVPVFRGEVKAGFTKNGEMIRVINNLAPGIEYGSLSTDFRNPVDAVKAAAGYLNVDPNTLDLAINEKDSNDLKVSYGRSGLQAEKMYFPTEPGVARTAWRVLVYAYNGGFYVIVDAETGAMLWRKNLTEDQTQAATYNVYINPNAMINVADNPFPITPGPTTLNSAQGTAINRTSITLVGNEAPYTFNNNGWITDGNNTTVGNNVFAGLDRKLPNTGSPANPNDNDPDGIATGTSRVFNFPYTPGNPNTNAGDAPLPVGQTPTGCLAAADTSVPTDFQKGITTQLFYITNRYHDELYRLGFTEAAGNFQTDNFGRGGIGNDHVAAQAQDCSGTNNANFTTPADGNRPTMQMYLWTGPTPDFDGSLDADVIVHEYTHGLSNRLHGNGGGLSTNMARGMGEGWGDFYGHSVLSEPTDPMNAIYTTGAYDTYLGTAGFTTNAYYGIRRYPKAVIGFTGGANNKPHNAFTFRYLNTGCGTLTTNANFAFARGPFGSATCDQVHNAGEVWSSTLWEVRGQLITRLGWAVGNRKVLQFVTDGMKLAPLGPTFLQERDAILAAAQASSVAPEAALDVADVWKGFALRGMGFSASIQTVSPAAVTEGFDLPNLFQSPTSTVSDSTGNNDGFPEPGEPLTITIPLTNNSGDNATGTTLQVVGGGSANYGTIAPGQTVSRSVSYTVPVNTPCGSSITLTFNVNSSFGPTSFTKVIIIGAPQTTFTENFDGVTAPAFPAGWTATVVQSGVNFVTTTNTPDSAPNAAYAVNVASVGGGTDLTSPSLPITASAATVSFRNRFNTEGGWDGGVVEISVNGGTFQDIIAAGGRFIQNGYNGVLGAGANNPLANRNAWSGSSNGYLDTVIQLPASAAGQNVQLKWRFGSDDNTVGTGTNPGWYVDGVKIAGNYACSFTPTTSIKSRADFDGDGKTDLSIFRQTEGNWYLNRSTAGFAAANWGNSTDLVTPGDFDGDNKTDLAIFRPSTSEWYVLRSSDGGYSAIPFGANGDVPVQADYDGDNRTDLAVYRPSTNVWYIFNSGSNSTTTVSFGISGDIPVRGDYDGDGKTDIAIYRGGQWWINRSTGGVIVTSFGNATDKPVPADYDGDNKDDLAVYRASEGQWYIFRSSDGAINYASFGNSTDIPVPGDYDGDGKDDLAVYRNGTWYLNQSTAGISVANFGLSTDTPIPTKYIP